MATRRRINTGIPSSIGVANPPFERRGCSMPTTSHGYSGSTRLFPWVVAKAVSVGCSQSFRSSYAPTQLTSWMATMLVPAKGLAYPIQIKPPAT